MRTLLVLLPLVLLLIAPGRFGSTPASAETLVVREVLVREGGDLYRSHLEADPVERALVRGDWTPPVDGVPDADGVIWKRVEAGDDDWITDDAMRNGYAYATVTLDEDGVWILDAMGYSGVYVNGERRIGNVYGYTDDWASWQPAFNFGRIPVRLRRGENRLLFFGSRFSLLRARFEPPAADLVLNPLDTTLPDLVTGKPANTWGSIVVLNATGDFVTDAELRIDLDGAGSTSTDLPPLAPHGVRKVRFPIRAPAFPEPGTRSLTLRIRRAGTVLHESTLALHVRAPDANRRVTFLSDIDGSVQFYGYLPARGEPGPKALVLSLHGAAVDALNQSGSYAPLPWAHVVAPTNRRPFGFNWEGWGRLDALEVLDLAMRRLDIHPDRVYLTGHSMGGHGSWHLGTLYPDRFAAVGPSAGWISFWSYRPDRPSEPASAIETMIQRATLPSRTLEMAPNLDGLGVYVLHGADDDNVRVDQARLIVDRLGEFHRDFVYHEQPDVGHWWDLSDEPGADCVTWAPMFDFFARHRIPRLDEMRRVRFRTPSPGVSARSHWVTVALQQKPFLMSTVDARLDPFRRRVSGETQNVAMLSFDLAHAGIDSLWIGLDGDTLAMAVPDDGRVWLERGDAWRPAAEPDPSGKGPHRYGSFKEAFTNRVQFVVGTRGTPEETAWALAKARYDAEHLWYHGNASIDVVPDTRFDPDAEPDRNVILYGNADTHAHWRALWGDQPVRVERGRMRLGSRTLEGDDFGVLAVRPRPGSDGASVGIVSGTGEAGFRLTDRRPYLGPGFAYPDLTVFGAGDDADIVRVAGFFGNDWSVEPGEFGWAEAKAGR